MMNNRYVIMTTYRVAGPLKNIRLTNCYSHHFDRNQKFLSNRFNHFVLEKLITSLLSVKKCASAEKKLDNGCWRLVKVFPFHCSNNN